MMQTVSTTSRMELVHAGTFGDWVTVWDYPFFLGNGFPLHVICIEYGRLIEKIFDFFGKWVPTACDLH